MSLLKPLQQDLAKICLLIQYLDDKQYRQHFLILSGASIGQHVRHILEFYSSILIEAHEDIICYDNRRRDLTIETERDAALRVAETLMDVLEQIIMDKEVIIQANYAELEQHDIFLTSSLFRELAYALDHSVHHQAIIKIGLTTTGPVPEKLMQLGVAAATIRYKQLK